jgi:FGGY-family pentulose kinase
MNKEDYVVGVDVGTGSARAGLFDLSGRMLASAVHPIQIFRPQTDFVEQSSRDIWASVCAAVRKCLGQARVAPATIAGVSFDATCSLVVLDEADNPVTVSPEDDDDRNIIVWMDHRATAQAEAINDTGHRVLNYVGGRLSPEQQPPKLRWLKENLPETWRRAQRFFDLADYLVYEACKVDVRSLCTVVCKWTYMGHEGEHGGWDRSFFEQAGLADLLTPNRVVSVSACARWARGPGR